MLTISLKLMPSVRAGFAASFQKGKADSLGDYIDTKNKFSQWMLHGYVAKDFGNDLNWISSINVGQNISKGVSRFAVLVPVSAKRTRESRIR